MRGQLERLLAGVTGTLLLLIDACVKGTTTTDRASPFTSSWEEALRSLATITLLAAAVVFAGCENSPSVAGLDAAAGSDGPEFNFNNGPDSPGPIVLRIEDNRFARVFIDVEKGVSSIMGIDIVAACLGIGRFNISDVQRVDVPDELERRLRFVHGDDLDTSVWPFVIVNPFNCVPFLTTDPLATGQADLRLTDNDVAPSPEGKNANAFGWMGHGTLEGPGGEALNYSAHTRCVGTNAKSGLRFNCSEKINLQ